MEDEVRLQKYMAQAGVASRRKSEELISSGCVKINGHTVTQLGVKVVPGKDEVEVNGTVIEAASKKIYILLNKPVGYITTTDDQFGRQTVMDLVKDISARIYPVGRLDADTEGLLIMTNDGDFTNRITHPSRKIEKIYIAEVEGMPTQQEITRLRRGVNLGDFTSSPAKVQFLEGDKLRSKLMVTIHEGKNRQVRRMMEAIGHPVITLKRTQIGPIMLGNIPRGKWRHMRKEEIARLMKGGR